MAFRRSGPPSPRLLGSHRAPNTMVRPLTPPASERKSACGFGDAANVKKRDLERKIRWYAPLSSCYGGPDRALSTGKTLLLYLCFDDSNLAWWVHHFASPRAAGSTFDNSHADSQRGRECSSSSSTPRSLNTRPERADKKRTALSHLRIPHSYLSDSAH